MPISTAFLTQTWRPVYIYEPEARAVTGVAGYGGEFSSWAVERMAMLPLALSEEAIAAYGPGRDGLYHAWRLDGAERYLEPLPLWTFFASRAESGCEARKLPPRSWQYIHIDRGHL